MWLKFFLACCFSALLMGCGEAGQQTPKEPGNPKRGQVYYRAVCTGCHELQRGESVPPMALTMQQWRDYFAGGDHAGLNGESHPVRYFMSRAYRQSVQHKNEVVRVFIAIPDQDLLDDVRAFAISRAKDSDNPGSCK
jgi:hypothetical protein